MLKRTRAVLLAVCCFYCFSAATPPPLHFRHLTIENGLSQSAVQCIYQDKTGFIWIGTKDGLNRYDGYEIRVFQHNAFDAGTISGNYITAILEDSRGYLWVGTRDSGLNRLNQNTERFRRFRHHPDSIRGLSDDRITALAEDSGGNIWIGTAAGLNMLTPEEIERAIPQFMVFSDYPNTPNGLSHPAIEDLLVDQRQNLWVATKNGLNQLVGINADGEGRFKPYDVESGLAENYIFSLFQSSDGTIWAGGITGLNRYIPAADSFTAYPHHYQRYRKGWGSIRAIEESPDGRLWLATPAELMLFEPASAKYTAVRHDPLNADGLSSNFLTSILSDRSGVIWIGTNGHGIDIHDPKSGRFQTYRRPKDFTSRIAGFSVRAIQETPDKSLWISADVLYRLNRRSGKLVSYETDSNHPNDFGNTGIWSMLLDRQQNLWAAGFRGVFQYNLHNGEIFHLNNTNGLPEEVAFTVLADSSGQIWIGTENYLCRYIPGRHYLKSYRYRQKPASREPALAGAILDSQGRIWLATDDGLVCFNPQTEQFRYYRSRPQDPSGLSHSTVLCILEDPLAPGEKYWIGTAGGGLNHFSPSQNQFTHYSQKDGLPNNVIYGILPDSAGNLWISTNQGLSRFTPTTGRFRNFDVKDGLQSNEFNTTAFYRSPAGEMFFGGIKGITSFFPAKIKDNPFPPPVVLTDFLVSNRSMNKNFPNAILKQDISRTSSISLHYRQNNITFRFAALDYSALERNQYRYQLAGFQEEWVSDNGSRSAVFTNLPPGDYVFRVKAANNDGLWNPQAAAVKIYISPPLWQTGWAYLLYCLILTGTLFAIRRYELNRLHWKNRLKVKQLETDKLQELDQLKSRFFANISHEFRTPLTLILGQLERVIGTTENSQTRRRLEIARRNSGRLLHLINQILDLSRLEAGSMQLKARPQNIIPFIKNLVYSFESWWEKKSLTISFECPHRNLIVNFDAEKLERVFTNLLANAIKFTPEGGLVAVRLQRIPADGTMNSPPMVAVRIRDSGPGIADDDLPHIFNRFYRASGSADSGTEGSGIGLALVKELVELHKGEITVSSQSGRGCEFSVLLPEAGRAEEPEPLPSGPPSGKMAQPLVDKSHLPDYRRETDSPEISAKNAPSPNRPVLLLVEDHYDLRAYLREQLQENYAVLDAADGESGLKLALEMTPDLIITDVRMPRMDGFELCRQLRKDERTSHIPIIMLTARAEMDNKIEGLELGVDDYLVKPFHSRELASRVNNLIEQRRRLRQRFREITIVKPAEVTAVPIEQAFLQKVISAIEAHLTEDSFDVTALAKTVGMSISQLNRKLRALVDQPAGQLLRSLRLQRAADLLKQNAATVAEITYQVGFTDQANFSRAFKKQFGLAPGEFRKKQKL